MKWILALVALALAVGANAQATQDADPVVQAMRDEFRRSMSDLQLEGSPQPYFIAYTVRDNSQLLESFYLGTSVRADRTSSRTVRVEVRVGSYELDNRNYRPRVNRSATITQALPISDDYEEIRRAIWRATDAAYKNAAQNYAAKLTALEGRRSDDPAPDFTIEEPFQYVRAEQPTTDDIDLDAVREPARELSSAFSSSPDIFTSVVAASAAKRRRIYLNSEGSFHDYVEQQCRIRTLAFTQMLDGTEIQDYANEYAIDCASLPPLAEMQTGVRSLISRLTSLRSAEPFGDVYNGPILYEGQAAAQILRRLLLPRLMAVRVPMTDDARSDSQRFRNPFLDKIGTRVVSAKIDVINDPTLTEFNGQPLLGHYFVDRQGIPARRTLLVEEGRLKTLLTTRSPVDEFDKSTGSSRTGGSAMPGNVLILPKEGEGWTDEEIRVEMNSLLDDYGLDYGIVVRRLANRAELAFGNRTSVLLEAYKVFADGREVLVPAMEITGYSDRTLRDIVAVSQEIQQYDTVYGSGSGAWVTPISIIAPSSLLIEELTARKMRPVSPKPPVVPHPSVDSTAVSN